MHTKIELLFVHPDEEVSKALSEKVEAMVRDYEAVLSRHLYASPLSELNRSKGPLKVCDDLYFVLELSEQMRRATLGYFDIAALSQTRERPSYRTYPPTHMVERTNGDVLLDLGGFAKGFAIEKARTILSEGGVQNAILNFGNSSVLGMGKHPLGDCWKVSPEGDSGTVFNLLDSALSISGKGPFGREHIIDPLTLKAASKKHNVAITGRSALICEILSTALYAAPESEHAGILAHFEGYTKTELL